MENELTKTTWESLRSQLMDNIRTQELLSHLKSREHVNTEEMMVLNLLMQEAAHKSSENLAIESKQISEMYSHESIRISQSAADFAAATSKSTGALKNATIVLAIATGILAASAIADIVLRLACSR